MKQIAYQYRNLPIPGGGYVTGLLFHPKKKDILYIRTDIGGTYRYNYETGKWKSLIDHVSMEELAETYPIAIAVDENRPERLYIACGCDHKEEGILAISEDYGETFSYEVIPAFVHGNWNGRGTGNRLTVSGAEGDTLYFASQRDGLLRTKDRGKSWEHLNTGGELFMTCVWVSADGETVVAGSAGVTTRKSDKKRGHSLYISNDGAATFAPLAEPSMTEQSDSKMEGYVAERMDFDGKYLYVTMANTGKYSYVVENGYSCDSGDTLGGKVLRFLVEADGRIQTYEDITPVEGTKSEKGSVYPFGFSGISSCASRAGLLTCTTICREDGDMMFRSLDYGTTWVPILHNLEIGKMEFNAPYMRPCCNGGENLIHWLSDCKINPFNENEVWFNTGTGVFFCQNLLEEECVFQDNSDGIEETVHLNVYSPTNGPVQLLDILGDLGGFAFTDVTKPCDNSFADDQGNRYITCINADFSDAYPEHVVVTPRGNWKGKTKGGLILSNDYAKTFKRLEMPFGISEKLDKYLKTIEQPNVNSGWAAMSADTKNIVWSVADGITLPVDMVIVSRDGGESFVKCNIFDKEKNAVNQGFMKVYSDRVNPELMYGFGGESQVYISKNGGLDFYEIEIPSHFPVINFGLIDCANKTEIRAEGGKEGVLYLACNVHGLWKMVYDKEKDSLQLVRLTKEGESVFRLGLGLIRENGDYLKENKAFYISGVMEGEYGFYRSFDEAKSWEKINTKGQMFGEINSIDGDCRTFGRFFLATGSRGVLYGEPV